MKIGKVRWKVVGVYAGKGIVGLLDNIMHQVEDREIGMKTIIDEDFNARTGNKGGRFTRIRGRGLGRE